MKSIKTILFIMIIFCSITSMAQKGNSQINKKDLHKQAPTPVKTVKLGTGRGSKIETKKKPKSLEAQSINSDGHQNDENKKKKDTTGNNSSAKSNKATESLKKAASASTNKKAPTTPVKSAGQVKHGKQLNDENKKKKTTRDKPEKNSAEKSNKATESLKKAASKSTDKKAPTTPVKSGGQVKPCKQLNDENKKQKTTRDKPENNSAEKSNNATGKSEQLDKTLEKGEDTKLNSRVITTLITFFVTLILFLIVLFIFHIGDYRRIRSLLNRLKTSPRTKGLSDLYDELDQLTSKYSFKNENDEKSKSPKEKTFTVISDKICALNDDIDKQLKANKKKYEDLKRDLGSKENELKAEKEKLRIIEKNLSEEKTKSSRMEKKLKGKWERNSSPSNKTTPIHETRVDPKHDELKTELEKTKEKINILTTENNRLKSEFRHLNDNPNSNEQEKSKDDIIILKNNYETKISDLNKKHEISLTQHAERVKQESEQEIKSREENIAALNKEIETHKNEITQLKSEHENKLRDLDKDYETTLTQQAEKIKQESEQELKSCEEKIVALNKEIKTCKDEITQLKETHNSKTEALKTEHSKEIENLELLHHEAVGLLQSNNRLRLDRFAQEHADVLQTEQKKHLKETEIINNRLNNINKLFTPSILEMANENLPLQALETIYSDCNEKTSAAAGRLLSNCCRWQMAERFENAPFDGLKSALHQSGLAIAVWLKTNGLSSEQIYNELNSFKELFNSQTDYDFKLFLPPIGATVSDSSMEYKLGLGVVKCPIGWAIRLENGTFFYKSRVI